MKVSVAAGALLFATSAAHAQGCTPEDGITIDKVEAMNQLVLDQDFTGFAAAIKEEMNLDVSDGFGEVAKIYMGGFTGCATFVQRTDVGGMVQNVVIFNGKVGPLFCYWLAIPQGDGYRVISFTLNTNLETVLGNLR